MIFESFYISFMWMTTAILYSIDDIIEDFAQRATLEQQQKPVFCSMAAAVLNPDGQIAVAVSM